MAAKPGPLVVIVGETASGKSAAAIELAQKINGEIICADSRTIYKGMDIGTAKPTKEQQRLIPHHLLDIVEPDQSFTVAQFKELANAAIEDITKRGKIPIMAGGSGLYVDSVLFDYQFSPIDAERNSQNPRHLKHANNLDYGKNPRPNTVILGIKVPREVLKKRINERVEKMVEDGLVEEAKRLGEKYGLQIPSLQTPGYKAFREYVLGARNLEQAKALFVKNDLDLAKRQRTWFKRNKRIQWINNPSKIVEIATTELNKL
jgi:tRNA dimethylallyltransferase